MAALGIEDAAERAAYLDRACAGEAAVRQRVEMLLAALAQAGSFLQQPAGDPRATSDLPYPGPAGPSAPAEGPGAVIGPYKLIEQIGEGGMGSVWMAQQIEPVKRLVAVKLIKAGMDSKQVIARFEAERQALALMDHPHIARVLDGGTTGAGRPYFVMDLVKGVPITRYCDEHHLTPRQRLELFIPVCQAIQHAHQKGIIHRDLKPSNVLVAPYDGKAVVKVIDFGVAKAAGQQLTDRTLVTGFGAIVGTLEYMSPEQAELNNHDIDTRSDIYALGVLLYELLAGSPPFSRKELEKAGMVEMLRVIREQEPSKPSTKLSTAEGLPTLAANRGTEPAKLTRLVRGELDWIVMKALEKDRNRRYETANGFARDIQRYLADEPVEACPPSVGYRLRKFARRNKGRLAVAALVLFFLASMGGVAGWAALQQAKQQAAQRASLEADISRDLEEALGLCRQNRLREASLVLDHAQALVTRADADEDLGGRVALVRKDVDMAARLEDTRLAVAADSVWDGTARYTKAFRDYGLDLDQLEPDEAAARIEVSKIRQQLVAALDDWLILATPRKGERLLPVLARADADPWRRQLRAAFVNKNLQQLRDLAREANSPAQRPAHAFMLGGGLQKLGDTRLAVEVLRRAQREHPGDFWVNEELGIVLAHVTPPEWDESVRFLSAAVALRPDSSWAHGNLGYTLHYKGRLDEAIACYKKAIALDPKVAWIHNGLGVTLRDKGQVDESIACYKKAIALDPKNAPAHFNLGDALCRKGQVDEAIACYKKAIALAPKEAWPHNNLGNALRVKGQVDEAIACYKKAIEVDPKFGFPHYCLGNALRDNGQVDEAITCYKKSIALDPRNFAALCNLGNALKDQKKLDEAISVFRRAIELDPKQLGTVLRSQGKLDDAIAIFQELLRLEPDFAKTLNKLAWNLATAAERKDRDGRQAVALARLAVNGAPANGNFLSTLGAAHYSAGNWKEALATLEKSMDLRKGGDCFDWFFVAMAHWQLGEKDKARKWFDQAVGWMDKNQPENEKLRRFRADAAELMKLDGAKK
jgi:tetratricopeptide (TPR) repeat protein